MIFFAPIIMIHVFWNSLMTETQKQYGNLYSDWFKLFFPHNMTVCGA